MHDSTLFQLINMKDSLDGPRQPRTEDRRTVFKMKEHFQPDDDQGLNLRDPPFEGIHEDNTDLEFSSK